VSVVVRSLSVLRLRLCVEKRLLLSRVLDSDRRFCFLLESLFYPVALSLKDAGGVLEVMGGVVVGQTLEGLTKAGFLGSLGGW